MGFEHLILAGGGHTHALLLLRWAMFPERRPSGLITLINKESTTVYSGMVPGFIAGEFSFSDIQINIRRLADQAKVAFIGAEIVGLNIKENLLLLDKRPPLKFTRISLDVGSVTTDSLKAGQNQENTFSTHIKPLDKSLPWIKNQDLFIDEIAPPPLTIIGSGLSAIEVAFSLRKRWPNRKLYLQSKHSQLLTMFFSALSAVEIKLLPLDSSPQGYSIQCTGSSGVSWLQSSGLPIDEVGRVITSESFQVIGHPKIFAVGDCGVLLNKFRPASGVWAVRAAAPLAKTLENISKGLRPVLWHPQSQAIQLVGGQNIKRKPVAWLIWGDVIVGPHSFLWSWKRLIDRRFMAKFNKIKVMSKFNKSRGKEHPQPCRGCAAKIPSTMLREALEDASLLTLGEKPEDAALVSSARSGEGFYQSVDAFPALLSDPWLNGRLTTLHACSDLWASGIEVASAQAIVTLPESSDFVQKELLVQTLSGIKSALDPQGAQLIGGHTLESRNDNPQPISMGLQVAICVNGSLPKDQIKWRKAGMCPGDDLLISRALGTGVLFAASMQGEANPHDVDNLINQLSSSQHKCFTELLKVQNECKDICSINASTDITGFGLLGHLLEMLLASNQNRKSSDELDLKLKLFAESIPSFDGAIQLIESGFRSTLAPANRRAFSQIDSRSNPHPFVELDLGTIIPSSARHAAIIELMLDPQTCGPLLISCPPLMSEKLLRQNSWYRIGNVSLKEC